MSAKRAEVVARAIDGDLRDDLRKVDRYGTRPQALQQWFYKQKFGSSPEWVYWIFWDTACLTGDYVVRIGVPELAARLAISKSTVDRAIATLVKAGALRRTQLPRPEGSFREPVALTEVLLPMEVRRRLPFITPRAARKPHVDVIDRPEPGNDRVENAPEAIQAAAMNEQRTSMTAAPSTSALAYTPAPNVLGLHVRGKLSQAELDAWLDAWKKGEAATFEFAPNSRLTEAERVLVRESKPIITSAAPSAAQRQPVAHVPRRTVRAKGLDFFTAQRLRRRLSEAGAKDLLETYFQEVTWSMQFGSLSKLETLHHALNVAVKLVREKRWSRPIRMPASYSFNQREARA